MIRPCGHLPDPCDKARGDEIGRLVGARRQTLPEEWDLLAYVTPGYDQRGNSCVGAAFAHGLVLAANAMGYELDPSRTAPYTIARQLADPALDVLPDNGCFPYRAIEGLIDWGVVARWRWMDDVDLTKPVPQDVLEAGSIALVTGVYRIYESGDALLTRIREAIFACHGVFFGMSVGESYMRNRGELYVGEPTSLGGHAQLIVGYRPGAFLVLNSWGLGWGNGGLVWIDERVIMERAFDVTVITHAPREVA
jgi:hypothetical protein